MEQENTLNQNKTFKDEQNELLNSLIDNNYYKYWLGKKEINFDTVYNIPTLELQITPVCNKTCEYCYLVKYGNELYPKEIRNQEEILNNISILLDYYHSKKFKFPRLDLFSGEIWHTDFGIKILTTILAKIKLGLEIKMIIIPSNFTFINYPDKIKQLEWFIDAFEAENCQLIFSASIDGKFSENLTRPFNNKTTLTDEFYDNLFKFCKKHNYGFHPMLSAYSIDYFKQNYTWFKDKLIEYNFYDPEKSPIDVYNYVMFLEVRNNDWTEEKLYKYIDCLNYMLDYDIDTVWTKEQDGLEYLASCLSKTYYSNIRQFKRLNYINYLSDDTGGLPGCTISYTLMIRAGDLSIVPCHRTSYQKFIYGKYIVKNNQIQGIEAQNPILANRIWNQKMKANPFCDSCYLYNYCLKGCYGSQYETTGDLFYPVECCCDLFKIRVLYLYHKKEQLLKKYNLNYNKFQNEEQNSIINCIKMENEEKYKKWMKQIEVVLSQNYMKIQY